MLKIFLSHIFPTCTKKKVKTSFNLKNSFAPKKLIKFQLLDESRKANKNVPNCGFIPIQFPDIFSKFDLHLPDKNLNL